MPRRVLRYRTSTPVPATSTIDTAALLARFEAIRVEQKVPDAFAPDVLAEAEAAAAHAQLPGRDETAVPFVTIDPVGSMDLDQALHIERAGDGHRVRYAIADVPAYVRAGGALDAETRARIETVYAPDRRSPLHPPVLSEGAASLLPDQVRPAFVWDLQLDGSGRTTHTEVYRARVRSVARLDYDGVQRSVDGGGLGPDDVLTLLKEVGERRIQLEHERGGASLPLPEQVVSEGDDGAFTVGFRPPVPAEDWNAQLSLMTGMAAAELMIAGRVGILRTMPSPDEGAFARFRRQARALGVDWPQGERYGDLLARLDLTDPAHLALVHAATSLFRGASYTPFDGEVPAEREHAAVAASYAHVTAPIRRLVDRFGLVVCEALSSGTQVPGWAREALPALPDLMRTGDTRANAVTRACTDAVEAAVMTTYLGRTLPGDVVDVGKNGRVVVQLHDPAIVANASTANAGAAVRLGDRVQVRVEGADITTGTVTLAVT